MRTSVFFFLLIVFSLIAISCKKNEAGGKSRIYGQVKHHGKGIPFSRVFIKYNASEFPGTDTLRYDAKVFTGADGNFSFDLYRGSYFLYGHGYDPGVPGLVSGGLKYILRNNEDKLLDVPVTED